MQATENSKNRHTLTNRFPRRHLLLVGLLGTLLLLSFVLTPRDNQSPEQETISVPVATDLQPSTPDEPVDSLEPLLADVEEPAAEQLLPPVSWHTETVRSGDNLSLIFQRAGLSDRTLMEFLSSNPNTQILKKIHPGHQLEFLIEEGALQGLRYWPNRLHSKTFHREDISTFNFEEDQLQPDIKLTYRQATIQDSLFLAGQRIQMDDDLIMELANIFGWDIDFGLDIRKGDAFSVLYEERFLHGEKIGNGHILAAEFTNQKTTFKAVRYTDNNDNSHYYTPDGKSMRKAFLRAPLDFRRISSNFNPKRLHPVFKTVRPHRGTDYAASTGTPVWASGDGKVIASSFTKANGNYIVIQHGNNIQTKYLHLSKRHVKTGQRVRQKQRIGSVGSTGYSTAPHLHYEFLLDGVHRNPRTILDKLPKAESIPDKEMADFRAQTEPLMLALLDHKQQTLLTQLKQE